MRDGVDGGGIFCERERCRKLLDDFPQDISGRGVIMIKSSAVDSGFFAKLGDGNFFQGLFLQKEQQCLMEKLFGVRMLHGILRVNNSHGIVD